MSILTPAEIAEIQTRTNKATPPPWGWFGNTNCHEIYLSTIDRGRLYVMQFVRWGMRGACPVFQKYNSDGNGEMFPAHELAPVDHNGSFTTISNPDADFIAHSREDVPRLLKLIKAYEPVVRAAEKFVLVPLVPLSDPAGDDSALKELEAAVEAFREAENARAA